MLLCLCVEFLKLLLATLYLQLRFLQVAKGMAELRQVLAQVLQALVLLNDIQFVEASRAFAERIVGRRAGDAEQLRWAFAECLAREPSSPELKVLEGALQRERRRYAGNEAAARAYLGNGESPRDDRISPAEHAAWAQVAALLLNLSEMITRN